MKSFLSGPALDVLQPPGGLAAWPEWFNVEILLRDCVGFLFINLISSLECVLVCLDAVECSAGSLSPHVDPVSVGFLSLLVCFRKRLTDKGDQQSGALRIPCLLLWLQRVPL